MVNHQTSFYHCFLIIKIAFELGLKFCTQALTNMYSLRVIFLEKALRFHFSNPRPWIQFLQNDINL